MNLTASRPAETATRQCVLNGDSRATDVWTFSIGSLVVAALVLCVMASSGAIQWMDNGFLLFTAAQGQYFPEVLRATSHPLYHFVTVLLYKLFGVHGVAYLNSALMAPIAYVVYRLSLALRLDTSSALLAALGVILLHNVFWVSTKIEVYALHLLIVMAAYWLVFDEELTEGGSGKIFVVGILTGLGAVTHQLTFVVLFPLYLYILRHSGWQVLYAIPGFVLGIFPSYRAILDGVLSGSTPLALIRLFMTGADGASVPGWEGAFLRFDKIGQDKTYALLVLLSLCGIGMLGVMQNRPERKLRVLWWAATLDLLFSLSYGVSDRFTFFLPGAALYTILGVAFVSRRYAEHRFARSATLAGILAHPLILISLVLCANSGLLKLPTQSSQLPYRNDIKYFLSPYIRDTSAETFVLTYDRQVPSGSVVLSDYSPMGALRSAQISGHFVDKELIGCEEERSAWPARMYLVRKDYCEQVTKEYRAERAPLGWILSR